MMFVLFFFFFKQKTAYEMRISDWSSDVCSSDLNWPTLRDNVLADVDRLNGLYTQTLENHGVEIIHERAVITGPNAVKLASGRTVTARYILVAVGAWPVVARKSVVSGKSGSVRVDLGGRRIVKKKNTMQLKYHRSRYIK